MGNSTISNNRPNPQPTEQGLVHRAWTSLVGKAKPGAVLSGNPDTLPTRPNDYQDTFVSRAPTSGLNNLLGGRGSA